MRYRSAIPYLVLILLPCLLLFPVLEGRVLLPANLLRDVFPWRQADPATLAAWNVLQFDGIAQFYPWRLLAARTWHQGYVPLWNPYEFCGTPFLANSQSAVLYPLNFLFELIPVKYAFGISDILHLFLTGAFLYAFLRISAGLRSAPALVGAAVWQLSTWQASWLALPSFLDTSCWIPLALLATDRLARRPTFSRAAALGATLGVMLLAGHLQIALYGLLITLAFALYSVARFRPPASAAIGCAVLSATLAAMIAAPQLLPVLELSRVSHRGGAAPSASGYAGYIALALPARHLVTLFVPGFFGRPQDGTYWDDPRMNFAEVACYIGILPFILAWLGALSGWRRDSAVRFFAAAAVAALLLALGTPLDALLYFGIPGFGQTGSPARVLVIWTLAAAALSAWGAQALLGCEVPIKRLAAIAFAVTIAILAATFGIAYLWMSQIGAAALAKLSGLGLDLRLLAFLILASAALAALSLRGTASVKVTAALLVCLCAGDLILVNFGYNPAVPPGQVYPRSPLTDWLAGHVGGDSQLWRVMPVNRSWSLVDAPDAILPPNSATVYGLPETQGYDSLQTGRYMNFAYMLDGRRDPSPRENGNILFTYGAGSSRARAASARYVVSLTPLTGLGAPLASGPSWQVYEDIGALPRARMPSGGIAEITDISPTRVLIRYAGAGGLVLADQWYPGWEAFLSSGADRSGAVRRIEVRRGPEVFRSLANLPGPSGVVEMRYEPATFLAGIYLGGLALLILSAVAARAAAWRAVHRNLADG